MKNIIYFLFIFIAFSACEQGPPVISDSGSLPVFKITIDEKYLWSPDSGLYIIGENGISYTGCDYPYPANYNQKWEFPATVEYFEKEDLKFSYKVGLRIKGNCSRSRAMKSLGLYWREEYGSKKLKYDLFPDLGTAEFKRLLLRNSGSDFGRTHLKDATIMSIFKDYANVDYQAYKPCVVYLNSEYWGIHNLREMITPHHFKYHYGVDDDHVDLLEGLEYKPFADDGNTDDYMRDVVEYLNNNNIQDNNVYQRFLNIIDLESYMDYIIINTYIYKKDWPKSNAKWWKESTSENFKKWHWVVYDTDLGMKDPKDADYVWIGELYGQPINSHKQDEFFIFNQLIKNKAFKAAFLDRYLYFIDSVFEKNRVENIIQQNKSKIEQEYSNHQLKWNAISKVEWNIQINRFIKFNNIRNDHMRDIIKSLMHEN